MNADNQQKEITDRECQESLRQFQTVVDSLVTLTRQMIARAGVIDIDAMNNMLTERQQLLRVAGSLRDKFVRWKQEQRISDQWKQFVRPFISELVHADEQLMLAVQQRKRDIIEQLAMLHRARYVERYVR